MYYIQDLPAEDECTGGVEVLALSADSYKAEAGV